MVRALIVLFYCCLRLGGGVYKWLFCRITVYGRYGWVGVGDLVYRSRWRTYFLTVLQRTTNSCTDNNDVQDYGMWIATVVDCKNLKCPRDHPTSGLQEAKWLLERPNQRALLPNKPEHLRGTIFVRCHYRPLVWSLIRVNTRD